MGIVVRLPVQRHARASSICFAAKRAKRSAVTPPVLAVSAAKTRVHHSEGILSRCHHFETADARAPISEAIASRETQSSMTVRNEFESTMTEFIGPKVLKFKDAASLDCELSLGQNVPMAPKKLLSDFELQFLARTYAARKQRFETQQEIAEELERGMKQDHYKQFEVRNRLPYEYLDRFIKVTGVTYEWLVAGRGPGPAWRQRYEQLLERQKKPKKGRKVA